MSFRSDFFLKKTLGEDFFESLVKVELWKPGTRTTIDHEEIKTALQIVPRVVMSLLARELLPMKTGESKEFDIEVNSSNPGDAKVRVTKHERDVYSGDIVQDNKAIVDFKYRSLPGIGLVIMSALELYDINELKEDKGLEADKADKIQNMIDQRLHLHDLIDRVVEQKMSKQDAVKQMVFLALLQELKKEKEEHERARVQLAGAGVAALGYSDDLKPGDYGHSASYEDAKHLYKENVELKKENEKLKKGSPLKKFIEDRSNKKLKKNEYTIKMVKGECFHCEDCGKNIFDGVAFSGCICLGDDMDRKVFIKKTEDGVKVRFGRGWDKENIEMLVETLRKKNAK